MAMSSTRYGTYKKLGPSIFLGPFYTNYFDALALCQDRNYEADDAEPLWDVFEIDAPFELASGQWLSVLSSFEAS